MAHLSLSLLGACEATLDGQSLTGFRTQKVRALLAYLAVHAERAHSREALASLLWPEQPDETARTYLRQALVNLRAVLEETPTAVPLLLISRATVQLNPACAPDLDLTTFRALLAACARHPHRRAATCTACARRLEQAVVLYGGGFLGSFYLRESTAFEEWAALTREALHQQAVTALAQLALYYERRGTYDAVERLARRQLELDPWREEAHQQLMGALALSGRRSAALEQYERCRSILRADLGVEPNTETEALYRQIRAEQLMPEVAAARAIGLPHPTTSFVGREADRAALVEQMTGRSCRLLTLVGAPGIGKTRLSLEVAAELVGDFEDGVVFVPLAALRDPALVVPTIAAALQIKEGAEESLLATLKRAIHTRHLLLVLDNFEQVVDAAEPIAELLAVAPDLVVLVTSRTVLHLAGEQAYPVPSLGLPDLRHLPEFTALMQYEAVALFTERARTARPDFQLTRAKAPIVAEICAKLDGLPLAIELAAARAKLFSPQALLDRLDNRLTFLTGGARDIPARQQTIRDTINWSYQLLDHGEQMLFARLGVFIGGCTLDAVELVCNTAGDLPMDTVDGIAALLDKSLLRQDDGMDGEPRVLMLETLREYALERLAASGEEATLRERHARYYQAFAERVSDTTSGGALLDADYDNLRATMAWALTTGALETALRLGVTLQWFCIGRGYLREACRWWEAMLGPGGLARREPPDGVVASRLYPNALRAASWHATLRGEFASGRAFAEEALAWYHAHGDQSEIILEREALAEIASAQGAHPARMEARAHGNEVLQLVRGLGDRRHLAHMLNGIGYRAVAAEDYTWARPLLEEALALFRSFDDASARDGGLGVTLHSLGLLLLEQGENERAQHLLAEGLRLAYRHRALDEMHLYLDGLASLAAVWGAAGDEGQRAARRAARLAGAAEGVRSACGTPLLPGEEAMYRRQRATARALLDDASWQVAWAEGRAMTLEQAIAYALSDET